MKIGKTVRWIATGVVSVASLAVGTPLALNYQAVAERLGWDHALADKLVPKSGPSPVVAFLLQPMVFISLSVAVGVVAGLWIDTALRGWDSKRSAKRWWEGFQSFSIKSAACIIAGITEKEFENSSRAKGIADEFRGYINSGHMPLMFESSTVAATIDSLFAPKIIEAPYVLKNVDYSAIILKDQIEKLAKARKWPLPWPLSVSNPAPLLQRVFTALPNLEKRLEEKP